MVPDLNATCAKTGPIQGQALLVVGRTDPVGPDEYNKVLGMSRADAVAAGERRLSGRGRGVRGGPRLL